MPADLDDLLTRWSGAGLIDRATEDRIRAFEREHEPSSSGRLRWPILVALAFGGLMVAAGVLLFVAAHWEALSPATRFALVLVLVAVFHVGAAAAAARFAALSITLHAIGTVALGAGIFLAGQIFNLAEHWPGGLMLWSLGAAAAAFVLRQAPQTALAAVLAPAWLAGEWFVAVGNRGGFHRDRVAIAGVLLLALCYFTSWTGNRAAAHRRALFWVGGIWLLPAVAAAAAVAADEWRTLRGQELTMTVRAVGWSIAVGVPTLLAFAFRRTDAWPNALAAVWLILLFHLESLAGSTSLYAWWAVAAIAFVAWSVRDARAEGINLGAAIFAGTVIAFYFSEVMDKLGRSASLVGLGLLFLAGGWGLERLRRQLVRQVRGAA